MTIACKRVPLKYANNVNVIWRPFHLRSHEYLRRRNIFTNSRSLRRRLKRPFYGTRGSWHERCFIIKFASRLVVILGACSLRRVQAFVHGWHRRAHTSNPKRSFSFLGKPMPPQSVSHYVFRGIWILRESRMPVSRAPSGTSSAVPTKKSKWTQKSRPKEAGDTEALIEMRKLPRRQDGRECTQRDRH